MTIDITSPSHSFTFFGQSSKRAKDLFTTVGGLPRDPSKHRRPINQSAFKIALYACYDCKRMDLGSSYG